MSSPLNIPGQPLTGYPRRVGDRVGVGAQSSSCLKPECEECSSGIENHCANFTGTYNSKYPDGSKSYGGYADYSRVPSHFVFKIPEEIPSEDVAPMLCGGITVYSPLKRNGAGPGKRVGIVGIGGLGHFGLLYAKVCIITCVQFRALTNAALTYRLSAAKKSSPSAAPARRRKTR